MDDKMRYVPKCIDLTGLREKPMKGEQEQPFHMTSVLHRLFPKAEWRCGKGLESGGRFSDYSEMTEEPSPDLQKGELIIKDNTADILGIGKKWKKIKVSHLI